MSRDTLSGNSGAPFSSKLVTSSTASGPNSARVNGRWHGPRPADRPTNTPNAQVHRSVLLVYQKTRTEWHHSSAYDMPTNFGRNQLAAASDSMRQRANSNRAARCKADVQQHRHRRSDARHWAIDRRNHWLQAVDQAQRQHTPLIADGQVTPDRRIRADRVDPPAWSADRLAARQSQAWVTLISLGRDTTVAHMVGHKTNSSVLPLPTNTRSCLPKGRAGSPNATPRANKHVSQPESCNLAPFLVVCVHSAHKTGGDLRKGLSADSVGHCSRKGRFYRPQVSNATCAKTSPWTRSLISTLPGSSRCWAENLTSIVHGENRIGN